MATDLVKMGIISLFDPEKCNLQYIKSKFVAKVADKILKDTIISEMLDNIKTIKKVDKHESYINYKYI
ncbi:20231_t:CDS:2 [Entrophospora sp. SA101]|nr:20231_t:CDS:2 [Entrophospora sp. SA101]